MIPASAARWLFAFAREGADVLISYLPEEGRRRETARWVEQAGRRVVLVPGDISNQQHCKQIVDRAVSEFGKLDILVNNAAFQRTYEKIEDITAEEWDRTFRVNVHAMFYLSQAAVPHMKPGAAIVNTTSIQSKDPRPSSRLRLHQGRDLELHGRPGADAGGPRYPRERGGAGLDLDAAHPLHDAGGEGGELRPAEPAFTRGSAQGAGPGLRAAGVGRGELHVGGGGAGDGRATHVVRPASTWGMSLVAAARASVTWLPI